MNNKDKYKGKQQKKDIKPGKRVMIGKIILKGKIETVTGLHIGGTKEAMQVGEINSVIRDSANNIPYIPGSALKGKLRSTLERFGMRKMSGKNVVIEQNRPIGTTKNPVAIHCCNTLSDALNCEVCRIFGSTAGRGNKLENFPAPLYVRDCLIDEDEVDVDEISEIKMETGIDRKTMAANPRSVERILPGTPFNFEFVLHVDAISTGEENELFFSDSNLKCDLNNLFTSMSIVEDEGLGGLSSRGYGKVKFNFQIFAARPLAYFKGDKSKEQGKQDSKGFSIDEARKEIDAIVAFLNGEAKSVLAR